MQKTTVLRSSDVINHVFQYMTTEQRFHFALSCTLFYRYFINFTQIENQSGNNKNSKTTDIIMVNWLRYGNGRYFFSELNLQSQELINTVKYQFFTQDTQAIQNILNNNCPNRTIILFSTGKTHSKLITQVCINLINQFIAFSANTPRNHNTVLLIDTAENQLLEMLSELVAMISKHDFSMLFNQLHAQIAESSEGKVLTYFLLKLTLHDQICLFTRLKIMRTIIENSPSDFYFTNYIKNYYLGLFDASLFITGIREYQNNEDLGSFYLYQLLAAFDKKYSDIKLISERVTMFSEDPRSTFQQQVIAFHIPKQEMPNICTSTYTNKLIHQLQQFQHINIPNSDSVRILRYRLFMLTSCIDLMTSQQITETLTTLCTTILGANQFSPVAYEKVTVNLFSQLVECTLKDGFDNLFFQLIVPNIYNVFSGYMQFSDYSSIFSLHTLFLRVIDSSLYTNRGSEFDDLKEVVYGSFAHTSQRAHRNFIHKLSDSQSITKRLKLLESYSQTNSMPITLPQLLENLNNLSSLSDSKNNCNLMTKLNFLDSLFSCFENPSKNTAFKLMLTRCIILLSLDISNDLHKMSSPERLQLCIKPKAIDNLPLTSDDCFGTMSFYYYNGAKNLATAATNTFSGELQSSFK